MILKNQALIKIEYSGIGDFDLSEHCVPAVTVYVTPCIGSCCTENGGRSQFENSQEVQIS